MVFIPRAQPLCRPVTLPMTPRGETEGILSFLPSIPVKSFIIQLPDYFKKLTRLWFSRVCVCVCQCVCVRGRESERERGIASGGMHPVALTAPPPLYPRCLPHPLSPHPSYTHFPPNSSVQDSFASYKTFSGGETPSSSSSSSSSLILLLLLDALFASLPLFSVLAVAACLFVVRDKCSLS